MKYNIMGFYQPRAVELGLDSNDLLVLRWFVDYAGTEKMRSMIIDNKIYYWVNYATVLKELPILRISKQTLYRKHFSNLCNANVLIHKQMKEGGNFSYYCYGINYGTLLYLQNDDPCVKNDDLVSKSTQGMSENTEPYVETYTTLASKNTEQILDNNINKNIKDNIDGKEKKIKEKVDGASVKAETTSNLFLIRELFIDEDVISAIQEWLYYKREKRQQYKPKGLQTLLKRLRKDMNNNGKQYIIDEIEWSISNNYDGIFPEKGYKSNQNQQPNNYKSSTQKQGPQLSEAEISEGWQIIEGWKVKKGTDGKWRTEYGETIFF